MHRIAGSRLRSLKVSPNLPFALQISAFEESILVLNESLLGVEEIDCRYRSGSCFVYIVCCFTFSGYGFMGDD